MPHRWPREEQMVGPPASDWITIQITMQLSSWIPTATASKRYAMHLSHLWYFSVLDRATAIDYSDVDTDVDKSLTARQASLVTEPAGRQWAGVPRAVRDPD
jgi:hypothetical protein